MTMFLSFFILKEGAKKEFYLGKKLIQKKNISKKDVHCRRKCHWWEIITVLSILQEYFDGNKLRTR
jgi:hypothetical protein